jgi:hypothetical protein
MCVRASARVKQCYTAKNQIEYWQITAVTVEGFHNLPEFRNEPAEFDYSCTVTFSVLTNLSSQPR